MPRTVAESSWLTDWRSRRSPSARTVASCLGERPIIDRVRVTLSFLSGTGNLLRGGDDAIAASPRRMQILQALDPAERVDRRLQHVVGIVRAEGLRENVLHARRLEDRPHGAARDDTRSGHRRLEEDTAGSEMPRDLAGDRRVLERDEDQVLLGVLDGLPDGLGHLVGLAEADAHVAAPVADHDQRREREPPPALDDLGHAVDGDDAIVQLEHARIDLRFRHVPLSLLFEQPLCRRNPPGGGLGGGRRGPLRLEHQAAGASRVGERLHSSVIHIPAAIEHDALDPLRLRLARQELADELGGGHVASLRLARAELLAPAVHGQQGPPKVVVEQLGVDMMQAAEDGQSRPRPGATHVPAHAPVPDISRSAPLFRDHLAPAPAFFPTLRRITSSEYLIPLPLYGSGSRSARSFAAVWPSSALSAPFRVIATCRSISAVMPSGSGKTTGCE